MRALDALLSGLIDYAGLFPPASEDMPTAVEHYAAYRTSEDRAALGRFIVPFERLVELENVAKTEFARGPESEPWRLSVLVGGDLTSAGEDLLGFNRRHGPGSSDGHAVVDVVELKGGTAAHIKRQRAQIPHFFTPYFEIPASGDLSGPVSTLAQVDARAKLRTGGVTPDAFPKPTEILDFIRSCHQHSVPFKATAGLHHPVRGKFSLTYEPKAPVGVMYGFLNVLLAAAYVYFGLSAASALAVLDETDHDAFNFTDDAIAWREITLGTSQIKAFRANFATSFGSCSFREPIDELASLSGKSLAENR